MHVHPFGHQLISIILCLGFGVGDGVKARWSEKRGAPEGLDPPPPAGVVGRERNLWQCTGVEFEACEPGCGWGHKYLENKLKLGPWALMYLDSENGQDSA